MLVPRVGALRVPWPVNPDRVPCKQPDVPHSELGRDTRGLTLDSQSQEELHLLLVENYPNAQWWLHWVSFADIIRAAPVSDGDVRGLHDSLSH